MSNYTYTLLSEGKLFSARYNNSTTMGSNLYLHYNVTEYDFLKQAQKNYSSINSENQFSLYPLAVRYVSADKNVYVIERPPFEIDIDFSTSRSYNYRTSPKYLQSNKMWVPWTVCIISLKPKGHSFSGSFSFSIYFNDKPLSSFQEDLVPCYLPNSSGGNICMGQDSNPVAQMIKDEAPIADVYNALFNSYFSGWNCDLSNALPNTAYFYKNEIIQRILQTNKGPKNFDAIGGGRSISKTYNQMLYLLSSLSLEELLDYIGETKQIMNDKSTKRREFIANHPSNLFTSINNQLTHYNTSSRDYNNLYYCDPSYFINDAFSSFDYNSHISTSARVLLTNYSEEYEDAYAHNPYIIAKLYSHFYENKNNHPSIDSFGSFSFELTNEEVSPYLTLITEESQDAVSV